MLSLRVTVVIAALHIRQQETHLRGRQHGCWSLLGKNHYIINVFEAIGYSGPEKTFNELLRHIQNYNENVKGFCLQLDNQSLQIIQFCTDYRRVGPRDKDLNQCTAQNQTEVKHIESPFDVINREMLAGNCYSIFYCLLTEVSSRTERSSQRNLTRVYILQTNDHGEANEESSIASNTVQDLDLNVLERMEGNQDRTMELHIQYCS